LPIALGILIASGQIAPSLQGGLFLGELSLDGTLRHTNGILPMLYLCKEKGIKNAFIPKVDEVEASVVPGINVYPVESLLELVRFLPGLFQFLRQKSGLKLAFENC